MTTELETVLRLLGSHAFIVYLMLVMIPLKEPVRNNQRIVVTGAILITVINAFLISLYGVKFYVRFYFLTLTIPHVFMFLIFSYYRGAKVIFALLSVQMVGNLTIINGLLTSYLLFGKDAPLFDLLARILTYLMFLSVMFKYVRPIYLKMANRLDRGWWVLNGAMILSYALLYFILFVPNAIFQRPIYFIHGYIAIGLTVFIYVIMSFLFKEIEKKMITLEDKEQLSARVTTLAKESKTISSIAYTDTLTGVKNRYSLYSDIDSLIKEARPFLLVFMDLDQLKEINDRYSHQEGDQYLRMFAEAVKRAIGDYGEFYRFAGDEFIAIVKNHIEQFDIKSCRLLVEAYLDNGLPFLGFSCGLSYFPTDGLTSDELISLADQLMYLEKKEKKQTR